MLKQTLKFILALCVATAVVVVVHAFCFAICTLPADIGTTYHRGDRVLVNRMVRANIRYGDLVVYHADWRVASPYADGTMNVGRVEALPGDTIRLGRRRFRIPLVCCHRCRCVDCKIYLVNTGQGKVLVHRHQVVGKAYGLTP